MDPHPRRWSWIYRVLPLFVVLAGLAATFVIAAELSLRQEVRDAQEDEVAIEVLRTDIQTRLTRDVEVLQSLKAFFEASDDVDRTEFAQHVASSRVFERLPGIDALGWAPVVVRGQEAPFVERVRSDLDDLGLLGADFGIRSDGSDDDMVLVEFAEPLRENVAVVGFDMASSPPRRAALDATRETGVAVATEPLQLVPDDAANGMVVLLAVSDPSTGRFEGITIAAFRFDTVLIGASTQPGLDFVVSDVTDGGTSATVLYETAPDLEPSDRSARVEVAGRTWEVSLAATGPKDFGLAVPAVGVAGTIATLALAAALHTALRSGGRAEARARELTVELRRSHEDLAVASRRLSQAAAAGNVGLWERDLLTGETWASAELAAQMGGSVEEWQSNDTFVERLHPDDRERVVAEAAVPTPAGQSRERRFRLLHADGDYRWLMSRSVTVHDDGIPIRVVGAQVDITAEHEREEALHELNAELAQSNKDLSEFTRVASHDLRSPLRAIATLAQFLRDDAADALDDQGLHHLERLDARVDRMDALLDDLLEYARAGQSSYRPTMVAPSEVIEDVRGTLDRAEDVSIELVDLSGLVSVQATPLITCVRNLIDNAIKHHPAEPHIEVRFEREDDWLVVSVTDDGAGIAPEYLEQVFEPFRTLKSRDEVEGSGVGLSVIKRSAEACGGSVSVTSVVGAGSTFRLRWPISH